MSTRSWVLLAIISLATAFAFGRYSVPEKIKIETKTVTVEVEKKEQVKTTDQVKTIKETVAPDGTKVIETKIETKSDTKTATTADTRVNKDESKTIEAGRSRVTISALAGVNPFELSSGFVFGGHITKPIIGPITLGVWATSQGVGGLSVGLQF